MIKFYKEWEKFQKRGDKKSRNFLIVQYLPLAKYIASTFPRFNPGLYSYDDMVSWACIGLINATKKFEPDRGIKFETYAISRIKGEIKDNLRKLTHSYYKRKKKVLDEHYEKLYLKLDRPPNDYEMAEELGVDIKKYRKMLARALPFYIISLDELIETKLSSSFLYKNIVKKEDFFSALAMEEKKETLSRAIQTLPKTEREIITMYYYEGLTMKETAGILNFSEGRISQLHTHALLHLKKELKKTKDFSDNNKEKK